MNPQDDSVFLFDCDNTLLDNDIVCRMICEPISRANLVSMPVSDIDVDELLTRDKPVIFACHAYPWLIHRLTCRRTNHDNFHVRGCKEEGAITTPFDMTVLNDLGRFHLVMDAIDRLPQTGDKGVYLKQQLKDKLSEHRQYINKYGQDMSEIRNWKWNTPADTARK